MKCPVCENQIIEYEKICPHCGWTFAEDVTVYGTLFGTMQSERCLEHYLQCLEMYRQSVNHYSFPVDPKGDVVAASEAPVDSKKPDVQYGIDGESWYEIFERLMHQELGDRLAEEVLNETEDLETSQQDESMPRYRWLNWQLRSPRNIRDVRVMEAQKKDLAPSPERDWFADFYRRLSDSIDEICRRIRDGSFENLYVGDYFDVKLDDGEMVRLVLAGFGKADGKHAYVNRYGQQVEYYAVVVPENCFKKREPMNRIFTGPTGKFRIHHEEEEFEYKGTYLYNKVLPEYAMKLQKALNGNILRRSDSRELELLSESQLNNFPDGSENGGFPLFYLHPERKEAGCGFDGEKKCPYWIREKDEYPFDIDYFELEYFLNNEGQLVEWHEKLGVRPYFYIG